MSTSFETPLAPGAPATGSHQPAVPARAPRSEAARTGGSPDPKTPRRRHPLTFPGAVFGVVVLAIILFLAFFNWNMLRGPIGRFASAKTGRTIRLEGDLKVHLLTWTPRVDVGGLKIGNPSWGPHENMAEIGDVAVSAKLLPLFTGRVILPLVEVDDANVSLLRDAQGRANWDFSNGKKSTKKPAKLPPIQNFVIKNGRIRAADVQHKITFAGTINANEKASNAYGQGFQLAGQGELNRKLFLLKVTGGPLINVRTDRPYPFDARVQAGDTIITAKGDVPKPFDLGRVDAAVSLQGKDLNDLFYLTNLALPNTPPYRIAGQLRRDGLKYSFNRINGRVGGSDLEGDLSADTSSGRPFVKGDLRSRLLDFKDLGSLFGAGSKAADAKPEQKAAAAARVSTGRLLPDATLQVDRIRIMDADVRYTASSVKAPNLPLRGVHLGMKLDHGLLTLDPIGFDFPAGRLTGTARINARGATPVSDLDMRIANVRMENFVPVVAGSKPLDGLFMGRAKLNGRGDSVHKAASTANGAVTAVIPTGHMRQAFAELLGIDATKGLFMLLGKDKTPTELRCALADFDVRNGTLTARRIVLDTGVVLVNGSGSINLADERMNLEFKGQPKKFRLVRVIAPLTVGGSLGKPSFGIKAGGAIAQAGIGVALGAVLTPLAAILPFVSPGLEKDANCGALFSQARASEAATPVPTKVAAASAKPKHH